VQQRQRVLAGRIEPVFQAVAEFVGEISGRVQSVIDRGLDAFQCRAWILACCYSYNFLRFEKKVVVPLTRFVSRKK